MTTLASPARGGTRARDAAVVFWSVRAFVYAATAAVAVTSQPAWPDLALARRYGALVARDGLARAGVGWLGDLWAWASASGGTAAALAAAAAAALAAFVLTETRARRYGGRVCALAASCVALVCSLDALRAGGGAASLALCAALALVLDRPTPRTPLFASALALVWCQIAPDGLLAPLIATAFALGARFDGERDPKDLRYAWFAVAGCALATLATPSLGAFPAQAFAALRVDRTYDGIVALHPIDSAPTAYRIGFTAAVFAFLAFGTGARLRVRDALLVAGGALYALANGAGLGIFGVLAAPVLAGAARDALGLQTVREDEGRAGEAAVVTVAMLFAIVLAGAVAPRADAALAERPYALAQHAPRSGSPHRFACANVDWCDYAVATGPPGTTALLDGRLDRASAADIEAQRTFSHASHGWRALLDARRVDAVLVRRDRAIATLLALRGDWRAVAQNDEAELFVRAGGRR